MMVDERETTNGHGCDLNCNMGPTTGATDKGGLLLDGNSGGFSFGEGTSAESLKIYKRRKRRKMSNSDEMTKNIFNDKIKAADGVASDQDALRLNFDAFPNGSGECSLRHCRKIVLHQMYQSLSGREDGLGQCIQNALVSYPEIGSAAVKESLDGVEKSDNPQTHNSATELPHFMSSGLLNQSESSTISELCGRAFFDILMSDKFSELCALLLKNFDGVNVNGILDVNAINMRMKTGAYESSPMLYLKDIQQVWTKLQQVGNEMVMLAKGLSDKSRDDYEQFVCKAKASEACNCQGCGEKADVGNCLVCDSCEDIYHVSCSEIVGREIPPKSWYCARCVSNGIGSPHDNCLVCEKLKTNDHQAEEDVPPNGFEADVHDDEITDGSSKICFICKSEVNKGDNFRTCGHLLCGHKFYHHRCLTSKQLGVYGPSWFCPSCLCRGCLVDKDDENIVLCDGCDQAYHTYCMSPQLHSIPEGSWFCAKCDRELKQIRRMKLAYQKNIQNKVKVEEGVGIESEKKAEYEAEAVAVAVAVMDEAEDEERDKSGGGGLEMLVTAAKTLSHQESEYGYHS